MIRRIENFRYPGFKCKNTGNRLGLGRESLGRGKKTRTKRKKKKVKGRKGKKLNREIGKYLVLVSVPFVKAVSSRVCALHYRVQHDKSRVCKLMHVKSLE